MVNVVVDKIEIAARGRKKRKDQAAYFFSLAPFLSLVPVPPLPYLCPLPSAQTTNPVVAPAEKPAGNVAGQPIPFLPFPYPIRVCI